MPPKQPSVSENSGAWENVASTYRSAATLPILLNRDWIVDQGIFASRISVMPDPNYTWLTFPSDWLTDTHAQRDK